MRSGGSFVTAAIRKAALLVYVCHNDAQRRSKEADSLWLCLLGPGQSSAAGSQHKLRLSLEYLRKALRYARPVLAANDKLQACYFVTVQLKLLGVPFSSTVTKHEGCHEQASPRVLYQATCFNLNECMCFKILP